MFVIFDRCDGGGTVFVNPEHVVAVTRHDEADTKTELMFVVGAPDKVAVVYGAARRVAEALGEVRQPRNRLRGEKATVAGLSGERDAFVRPAGTRSAAPRPLRLSDEWQHLEP